MLSSEVRLGQCTWEWSRSGSQRGLALTVPSPQELVLFVSVFLTLRDGKGAAEVRELSPTASFSCQWSFGQAGDAVARDIAAAGVCFGDCIVWAVEEQSG